MPKKYEYHEGKKAQEILAGHESSVPGSEGCAQGKEKARKKRAKNAQSQTTESDTSRDSGEA